MPRPRSAHVQDVRSKLVQRLSGHGLRPGQRFLSNRAIASQFRISYQTAHRIVGELVEQGLLVRRAASGTYVPGEARTESAALLFHARAKRAASFGARLLEELAGRLTRERIEFSVEYIDPQKPGGSLPEGSLPVVWELHEWLQRRREPGRRAVLLNDRPASGLESIDCDCVSVDDFTGGACAAQMLVAGLGRSRRLAVLAGPEGDKRSGQRVSGFESVATATVIPAGGWYVEHGLAVAGRALAAGADGVFCCNDRLAEAVIRYCGQTGERIPPLVGFDDAPIAERLDLTTIAVPWAELVNGAVGVIRRRLAGDTSAASRLVFVPRPIRRATL